MARPALAQTSRPEPTDKPSQARVNSIAANDNQVAANDNDEGATERSPSFEKIQTQTRPMRKVEVDRGSTSRRIGTSAQIAGAGTQATGKAVEVTGAAIKGVGKGLDVGGSALIRAGAAASSTGVGAIVGVPTIALGAGVKVLGLGTQVAGSATKAAGKSTQAVGRGVRKTGGAVKKIDRLSLGRKLSGKGGSEPVGKALQLAKRLPGPVGKAATLGGGARSTSTRMSLQKTLPLPGLLWERRKVIRANIPIFSTGFSIWFGIQLPIALLSLAFLGLAYTIATIKENVSAASDAVVGETVTYVIGKVYEYTAGSAINAADWLFEKIFGFSLAAIGDPSNWFFATYFLVVMIGWVTLLIAAIIYLFFMVNPFTGQGWKWKMGGFIIAAFGYLIPGLNILPWFAVYSGAVFKNPE